MLLDESGKPLVSVHVCWNDAEAEIVTSCLRAHGIEARLNSEVPRAVLPLTIDGLGETHVLVEQGVADEARSILAERKPLETEETSTDG